MIGATRLVSTLRQMGTCRHLRARTTLPTPPTLGRTAPTSSRTTGPRLGLTKKSAFIRAASPAKDESLVCGVIPRDDPLLLVYRKVDNVRRRAAEHLSGRPPIMFLMAYPVSSRLARSLAF